MFRKLLTKATPAILLGLSSLTGIVAAPLPVFHTSGRFLLDPCGDTVTIRGIELPVNQREYIPEVAKTGANFVRVLVSIPPADYPTPLAEIDSILATAKKCTMAVDLSLNNKIMDGSAFVQADVLPLIKKYEDILCLHAMGEGGQNSDTQWVSECKATIKKIRDAGIRCPLFMLSTSSGRDPNVVLHNGQKLVDFDPQHNILCGVQLYWGYTSSRAKGWWLNNWGFTDKDAIDSFALKSFPIVAGINNHDPYGDPWLDYETQLSETQAKHISWFWWDWYNPWDNGGRYHLSTTGKYGDWGYVNAGGPDLDKFTVSGAGLTPAVYEAENTTSDGPGGWGAIDNPATGGKFLCCSGPLGDWVEWNNVDGGAGGTRQVAFTYSNGDDYHRSAQVVLNGAVVDTLEFANSGPGAGDANFWRVWKDEGVNLTLRSGMNTIRLVIFGSAGPFPPDYALRTVITHSASIKNTSIRSKYLLNGACGGTAVDEAASFTPRRQTFPTTDRFALQVTDLAGRSVLKARSVDSREAAGMLRGLPKGIFFARFSLQNGAASKSISTSRIVRQ